MWNLFLTYWRQIRNWCNNKKKIEHNMFPQSGCRLFSFWWNSSSYPWSMVICTISTICTGSQFPWAMELGVGPECILTEIKCTRPLRDSILVWRRMQEHASWYIFCKNSSFCLDSWYIFSRIADAVLTASTSSASYQLLSWQMVHLEQNSRCCLDSWYIFSSISAAVLTAGTSWAVPTYSSCCLDSW